MVGKLLLGVNDFGHRSTVYTCQEVLSVLVPRHFFGDGGKVRFAICLIHATSRVISFFALDDHAFDLGRCFVCRAARRFDIVCPCAARLLGIISLGVVMGECVILVVDLGLSGGCMLGRFLNLLFSL